MEYPFKNGDTYWFVGDTGVQSRLWCDYQNDRFQYEIGNAFHTEAEAEEFMIFLKERATDLRNRKFRQGYNQIVDSDEDVMPVADFRESCECGGFIDYDGFGNPAKMVGDVMMMADIDIYPSEFSAIPYDATHIVWYNR